MVRVLFLILAPIIVLLTGIAAWFWPPTIYMFVLVVVLAVLGYADLFQRTHTIRRNFPIIGRLRYMLEAIRPEIQQYFIESDTNGQPFSREQRSIVYQRAKATRDTVAFGTKHNVYASGYEWIGHSLAPLHAPEQPPRILIGGPDCRRPYSASLLNISAMSYGSLSTAAILALNGGAKDGGFAHNTGEGGVSPYHLEPGGDLIWQLGTGYFGCRDADGNFDADKFSETATRDQIKMIEIKLSQGAKPGHGGILPASKLTKEIARIRGVPMGHDVLSPPGHSSFDTPVGLLRFVARVRELCGGKPVGFKLCVGRPVDVMAVCKAMLATGITPDFITVDGAEGGTGAAPLEFTNAVGYPLLDGLTLVHNCLVGVGLRDRIKIIASGRVIDGFDMAVRIALGADLCNSARGMMFALGCIQALRCNTNECPAGVATQDPRLIRGLDVADKRTRVANFHGNTVRHFLELLAAAGCTAPEQLCREMIHRRFDDATINTYADLYPELASGALLADEPPARYAADWARASAERFNP
ncbi:MAG: FMN-binding glutamate synthase family protein [Myxococcales bacterium]|nr:FMN-binding glutamate synthase family protein [Myxococcales bacterium]MCB9749017.1 FMN-binding glutamate synthase family protein [Myxococcales bacterium]